MKTNAPKLVVNPRLGTNTPIDDVFTKPQADAVRKAFAEAMDNLKAHLTPSSHARGDDDDSRQIIADLISDDDSPFLPDDEMALRHMSGATLKEMKRKYLKRKAANASAVSNGDPAFTAMHANIGAVAYLAAKAKEENPVVARINASALENDRRRQSADEYIKRNPRRGAVTANRDDPAFQAMQGESLADALRRKREGK
jgi:hypothetical protein